MKKYTNKILFITIGILFIINIFAIILTIKEMKETPKVETIDMSNTIIEIDTVYEY